MDTSQLSAVDDTAVPEPRTVESANQETMTPEETRMNPTYHNGYSSDSHAQYSSRPAEVHSPAHDSAPQETDRAHLASSPSLSYQPQPPNTSRPSSSFSSGPERHGVTQQQQQENNQRSQMARNSVVLKVGMVGDAQIGKTSLMVKYVEGSWDEDYIQTLGKRVSKKGDVEYLLMV